MKFIIPKRCYLLAHPKTVKMPAVVFQSLFRVFQNFRIKVKFPQL